MFRCFSLRFKSSAIPVNRVFLEKLRNKQNIRIGVPLKRQFIFELFPIYKGFRIIQNNHNQSFVVTLM